MGRPGTWQIVILLVIILLLFGAKRLPDAARGLGRSLRIFKAETKGLADDAKGAAAGADDATPVVPPPAVQAAPQTPPPAVDPVPTERAEG